MDILSNLETIVSNGNIGVVSISFPPHENGIIHRKFPFNTLQSLQDLTIPRSLLMLGCSKTRDYLWIEPDTATLGIHFELRRQVADLVIAAILEVAERQWYDCHDEDEQK